MNTLPTIVGGAGAARTAGATATSRWWLTRWLRAGRVLGWLGAALLVLFIGMAVLAPVLAGHSPRVASGLPYEEPTANHLLGTDDLGVDIFAALLYGARITLAVGVLSALFGVGVGLTVALLAGYFRGAVEVVLMRTVDFTLSFPFLPLVILLATFLGRGFLTTVLVIAGVIWARPARVMRAQVLKVREFGHVAAARAMGAPTPYILSRHVLPRVTPLAIAQFVRAAHVAVFIEASLAFLGLGDPNGQSWGTMLFFANSHNAFLTDAWRWWILPPGLALAATVLGFAFVGYALEEWADPRLARAARPARPASRFRRSKEAVSVPLPLPSESVSSVLEVRDLRVRYNTPAGPLDAVDGVSFAIGPRRVVGLVGESGCGKSSLSMALLRLLRPPGHLAGGAVVLDGCDLASLSTPAMARVRGRQISLVPQSAMNALNPAYSVHRQVREAAALTRNRAEAATRAHELLDLVGIPAARHGAYPHELSGGMRQRVVIAMAIANEPSLLIADEPLTGLDVVTQEHILQLLLDLRDRFGMAILLISHDLPVVGRIADDLLVMYAGRIVESGPAAQVMHDPHHPYTRALLRAFPSVRGPQQVLASIPGEPPDLLHPPCGCRYHPRCAEAFDACSRVNPPLFEPIAGHYAACLLEKR